MSKVGAADINLVALANLPVKTPDGAEFPVGRVWKNQTAILVFLRHFACISCRGHAAQVWAEREKYEKGGSKIIFIGNGSPQFIEKFKEDLGMKSAVVLTDPTLETFRAAGFRKGFSYFVQAKTIINAFKLFKDGHRQVTYTKEAGTYWQLGGILVISQGGKVLYHHVSEFFGDFPDEPHSAIMNSDEAEKT